jgi:hypothetical protein
LFFDIYVLEAGDDDDDDDDDEEEEDTVGVSLAGTQRAKSIRQDLRISQKSSLFSHPVRQECTMVM